MTFADADELAKFRAEDAAALRAIRVAQDRSDAWRAAFLAALTGSADSEQQSKALVENAERIADAAVKKLEEREVL